MATERIVIVGAAAAGLAVAEAARSMGHQGELVMIGDETHLPYDRPPLSKQLLLGEWTTDRLALRGTDDLARLGLELRLGVPADSLDTEAREVVLATGDRLGYDALVVATGVRARWLPGTANITGVHVLRDIADALALRERLVPAARLVVVGAGVLGAEAAAVAVQLGVVVTLVDPQPLPMARVVGNEVGTLIAELHREHGVDLRCGVGVRRVCEHAGAVESVLLDDGTDVPADVVLVAVGATPAVEWLRGSASVSVGSSSPSDGAGGVLCAPGGRAAERVYAAGDVAAWRDHNGDRYVRVEHRLNATEQGRAVARSILDPDAAYTPSIPYFWSDQYGLKLQSFGLPDPEDEFVVVAGALEERRFVGASVRDGVVTGALGIGMVRPLREWRNQIGKPVPAVTH